MNLGVILPHTKLSGGVKRFFELGKIFMEKGHSFTVYTPDGLPPAWIESKVRVVSFDKLMHEENELLFITDRKHKNALFQAKARYKIFYHVSLHHKSRKMVRDKRLNVFACSTNVVKYDRLWHGVRPFPAIGGINSNLFYPENKPGNVSKETFTILVYGRISDKIKGTMLAVRACERLYTKFPQIRLILFDTPLNENVHQAIDDFHTHVPFTFIKNHPIEKNPDLYRKADLFVGVEKGAGWSNTVAEAMACGVPVVATHSGTLDFLAHNKTGIVVKRNIYSISRGIEKLITSPELREELARNGRKKIEEFDWQFLAERILNWHQNMENGEQHD